VKKIKVIVGVLVLAILVSTVWQIAACELANIELKDDLKDVASLGASRIGLAIPQSDDHLRATLIRKAAGHDIVLDPEHITVQRIGVGEEQRVFLVAKYRAQVWTPGLRLVLHFTATSGS
jgi:hypothetical protein